MQGFNARELGYVGEQPSADDAIADANYQYAKMARAEMDAGREIPIVDIPLDLRGDGVPSEDAIYSVEAGDAGLREASRRRYSLSALGRLNWDRIFGKKINVE